MNKVVVNPSYEHLTAFVEALPQDFESVSQVIQNKRNDIRICDVDNTRLVIKSFKGMYFPNKLAYSLFWKSKAQRSYEYSFLLQQKGVKTPDAIAYVDCHRYGFLVDSYFVSLYDEHPTFENLLGKDISAAQEVISDLAKFTRHLHLSGIYHADYSNGNIICQKSNGKYSFGLLDLNRVKFKTPDFEEGLMNLSTLNIPAEMLRDLCHEYAALAGHDASAAEAFILDYREKKTRRREKRRWLKKKLHL